jgi:hypothetical protein
LPRTTILGAARQRPQRGNIYDHKRHQPTERDVRAAKKAAGIPSPSDNKAQVEEEVNKLLQQSNRLDKTAR